METTDSVIVDTCVWVSAFNASDNNHELAQDITSQIEGKIIFTDELVSEILTVLKLRASKRSLERFVLLLETDTRAVRLLFPSLFKKTYGYFTNNLTNKLSFVDTSLLILSKKYEVITFDKALQKEIQKSTKQEGRK